MTRWTAPPPVRKLPVRTLLESLPDVGKVRAQKILDECERRRYWFSPQFRESPGRHTSAGTSLVGITPARGSWRSGTCSFPGSMFRSRRCRRRRGDHCRGGGLRMPA
ncbi:hypothetical protein ACIBCO_35605 [Streptomyces violascens]|uniref:hypothetical protein n=1 Tax=Streptomyces violascens TaxID=67381 RepID=UPI0037AA9F82